MRGTSSPEQGLPQKLQNEQVAFLYFVKFVFQEIISTCLAAENHTFVPGLHLRT